MIDPRLATLAHNLVNYSVAAKKGDRVLIEANGVDAVFVAALIEEVYRAEALPFVEISDSKIQRALLNGLTEPQVKDLARYACMRMNEMDCYIGVRGGQNIYETADVPSDKTLLYAKLYAHPVHHNIRVAKTRWVILRYPNESMSQLAQISTKQFEDFYFDVCNLDYAKMDKAMDALICLLDKTDTVRITAQNTDITFSIKGIPSKKCSGHMNIPDGEVYTAPVKNSVNGRITYNVPSVREGKKFENVELTFKNGKIIQAQAGALTERLNQILDTDEGARYVGEFAFGVNPFITKPIGDILFDEKIAGSIHFTPGSCYEDSANNGNTSAVHWDLILMQTPEYGGGEIFLDGVLIRKDGMFVPKELTCLNPEKLK
ncbi:MAG: aminopeptidase [Firmicutes bacterium]|nr:aminopeptidase [Bacillota bacterium]